MYIVVNPVSACAILLQMKSRSRDLASTRSIRFYTSNVTSLTTRQHSPAVLHHHMAHATSCREHGHLHESRQEHVKEKSCFSVRASVSDKAATQFRFRTFSFLSSSTCKTQRVQTSRLRGRGLALTAYLKLSITHPDHLQDRELDQPVRAWLPQRGLP